MSNADDSEAFEATYAVKLDCEDCVSSIRSSLAEIKDVHSVSFDLDKQLVSVTGMAPPSAIIEAMQAYGRDAILRGSGKPNSAAVAILESFGKTDWSLTTNVRGLVRMVTVSASKTIFDITVDGVPSPGLYAPSIRVSGDILQGTTSTGEVWHQFPPIECNRPSILSPVLYSGQSFVTAPLLVSDLIGRAFVVSNPEQDFAICGVIARSAGSWENHKEVCACSGKTVWQERSDAIERNITK